MMKIIEASSTRVFALALALIAVVFSGIALFVNLVFDFGHPYIFWFISLLLLFLLVYIPGFYVLNNFIYQKIRPVYETISKIYPGKASIYRQIEDDRIIDEVNREVRIWAEEQSREISQLRANANYRKEFLGNVSHELKTPIFNIQGYVLTLLDGAIDDAEINRTYLEKTEKNINRLISIVDDLSTITGLESGELSLNYSSFDIHKVVLEIFDMHQYLASQYNNQLIAPDKKLGPIFVYADKQGIIQVLTNLVVNAIKYGTKKGKTQVILKPLKHVVHIIVRDNGVGIPEKHLSRIFERFYRVDKSRSRERGGTGLGLAIVKHVIEAHDGTIKVRSKEGLGTDFEFTLNRAPDK